MQKSINKYAQSVDSIARNHISRVTIQIWKFPRLFNKKRRETVTTPRPFGTGILVDYMGLKFIFTAQHITSDVKEEDLLYIQTNEGEFLSIAGKVGMIDSPEKGGVDLAYIELTKDLVNAINLIPYKSFLDTSHIGFGGSLSEGEPIIALGFPEKNTRVDKITLSPFSIGSIWLLNGASEKAIEFYKLNKENLHVLNYHGSQKDLLTDEKTDKIDPEGMSGGGIWKIWGQPFLGETIMRYHLIGILTEYRKGKYHILIGNRIELLINFINKTYGFPLSIEPTS